MTQLTTPETSTILMRRNSALANNKENQSASTPTQPLPNNSSSQEAKPSPGTVSKKQK